MSMYAYNRMRGKRLAGRIGLLIHPTLFQLGGAKKPNSSASPSLFPFQTSLLRTLNHLSRITLILKLQTFTETSNLDSSLAWKKELLLLDVP